MKTAKDKIRVCVIDDHSVVRMGFKYMLSFAPDMMCVGEATGGENAAAFVRACGAEVVLLDVRMPGTDGLAALDEILTDNPAAKVVMLTTSDTEEDIYRAVTMGAKGYVLKETDPQALLASIRTVAAGGTAISPEIRKIYDIRASERGLTAREREVLGYVAKGLSNDEIARLMDVSFNTVKSHLKSILLNLGVADRAEAVAQGIRRGLIG
ncbi:MAG: response regulator [Kiritimatiellia bacterium]